MVTQVAAIAARCPSSWASIENERQVAAFDAHEAFDVSPQ